MFKEGRKNVDIIFNDYLVFGETIRRNTAYAVLCCLLYIWRRQKENGQVCSQGWLVLVNV